MIAYVPLYMLCGANLSSPSAAAAKHITRAAYIHIVSTHLLSVGAHSANTCSSKLNTTPHKLQYIILRLTARTFYWSAGFRHLRNVCVGVSYEPSDVSGLNGAVLQRRRSSSTTAVAFACRPTWHQLHHHRTDLSHSFCT